MKKEEILAKSRREDRDEGLEHAQNQGRKIGSVVFVLLAAAILLLSWLFWQMVAWHAVLSLFWAYCAAAAYPHYRFTRKPVYMVVTVAGWAAALVSFALFVRLLVRYPL